MPSVLPHLPSHLLASLRRDPSSDLPFARSFEAGLLLSDISGFSALTEKLQARGREGAEEVARLVSHVFEPAIDIIHDLRGSLVSFGGDALFSVFPGPGGPGRAVKAAHRIRDCCLGFGPLSTSAGTAHLKIAQAVHAGRVQDQHVGSRHHRIHLVAGAPIPALARLQSKALAGAIRVSRAASTPGSNRPRRQGGLRRRMPEAKLYLAPEVRRVIGSFEGSYRHVAILFLETRGWSLPAHHVFALTLQRELRSSQGLLLKTDLSAAGTKWLCVFGIPEAHEDDPERAAHTATQLLSTLPERHRVRAGLHSGIVAHLLIGSRRRRSLEVMGETVNIAARVLEHAAWGEVLITSRFKQLLSRPVTHRRQSRSVKGLSRKLSLHALDRTRPAPRRLHVTAPTVGRREELAQLRDAIERAQSGQGGLVAILGEAGLGKSRLKWEAVRMAQARGLVVQEGRCPPFGAAPYHGIVDLVRRLLGIDASPSRAAALARIDRICPGLGSTDRDHLCAVLGAHPLPSSLSALDGAAVRLNNMVAIRNLTHGLASSPCLLVLEDMHWADEVTCEAVRWIARGLGNAHAVLLLLARPGYEPPESAQTMHLQELPPDQTRELVRALVGRVSSEALALLTERGAGNPFYVEELARSLIETGLLRPSAEGFRLRRPPEPHELPASVETIIEGRIDRLGLEARRLAQAASVIGRSFDKTLLRRIVGRSIDEPLRELCAREVVHPIGSDRTNFTFKHALSRDVTYSSTLEASRKRLHRTVALNLEKLPRARRREQLPMLGHHWERAGSPARARTYYITAAKQASRSGSLVDAHALLERSLELFSTSTTEAIQARLDLCDVLLLLGRHQEVERSCRKARRDARRRRNVRLEAESCRVHGVLFLETGSLPRAEPLLLRAVELYRDIKDVRGQSEALENLANLRTLQTRTEEGIELHHQALRLARRGRHHRAQAVVTGNLAVIEFRKGNLQRAKELLAESHRQYRGLGDQRGQLGALINWASIAHMQGDLEECRELLDQSLDIARKHGYRQLEAMCLGNISLMLEAQGRIAEAEQNLEASLFLHREIGARREEALGLANLGNLKKLRGRLEEAEEIYRQALQLLEEVDDRRHVGHVRGNLGGTLRDQGRLEEARQLYEEGLAIDREVGDRRNEGFALIGLAQVELWDGRLPRAIELIAEAKQVFGEMSERFGLANCALLAARLELASGADSSPALGEAQEAARSLGLGPASPLVRDIASVARASAARARGETLLGGLLPQDVPPAFR